MIRAVVSVFAVALALIAMTGCPGPLETAIRTANAMSQFGDGVADLVRDMYVTAVKQAAEESQSQEELDVRLSAVNAKFKPIEAAYNKYRLALVALQQAITLCQVSAQPPSEEQLFKLMGALLDAKKELGSAMEAAGIDPGDVSKVIPLGEN